MRKYAAIRSLCESAFSQRPAARKVVKESKKRLRREYIETYTVDEDIFYDYVVSRIENRWGTTSYSRDAINATADWLCQMFSGAGLVKGSDIDGILFDANLLEEGDHKAFDKMADWYETHGNEIFEQPLLDEVYDYSRVLGSFERNGHKYLIVS